LALRLSELGANVIAVSKSDENLKQLVAEVINRDFDFLLNNVFTLFQLGQQNYSGMC